MVPLVAALLLLLFEGELLGLPHGLGIAAPVAPSFRLSGDDDDDEDVSLAESCASIKGSWMFRYMLESALNPPGMFSSWLIASSCCRIACCIISGFLIICIACCIIAGSFHSWRSSGLFSISCLSCGLVCIVICMAACIISGLSMMPCIIGEFIIWDICSGVGGFAAPPPKGFIIVKGLLFP